MSSCEDCSGCDPTFEGLDLSEMVAAPEQPPIWERDTVDRIFIKQMYIAMAGTLIPQHSHPYPHATLLAVGAFRLWKDGVLAGDHEAPKLLTMEPRVKHLIMALVDNTIAYCIHNTSRSGKYEILEEQNLLPGAGRQ